MKQQKITLTKNVYGQWSYEDIDFEKSCMTPVEVVAMFIARFAATIQAMADKEDVEVIEIIVKKC